MSDWTDELKKEVIDLYQAGDPTADTSSEILNEIAEKIGKSPNAVRIILVKAEVYVKKTPAVSTSGGKATASDKPKRISKADAIEALTSAITDSSQEVDEEILAKLTGKAAQYFTGVVRGLSTAIDPATDED